MAPPGRNVLQTRARQRAAIAADAPHRTVIDGGSSSK